ncbi:hypothetical protein O181_123481 [Austropuccinia psidii MF-1]|uniref:Uncharacterized protein n=1 Tax=Austropuccinia psidii MF-1 TaxID=1389203 RepID=A0A9Q3KPB2_9BASI|nr:hypothetical protein [Austropuccinia psidii MF-1]
MESQQEVKTPGGKDSQDKGESSNYPSHRRTTEPDREYSDSFRLKRSKQTIFSSSFTQFRHQKISDQESPSLTIPSTLQEKKRIKREKQDFFQQEAEKAGPHDPEAVGLGERSSQEPEIVVNNSNRIRSPASRNITPTQTKKSVATPESDISRTEL